jgi:serine/threonine-protein kinase
MKLCLACHIEFSDDMDVCPKDNVTLVTLSEDPLIGATLQDRYKIESVIGRGAMGAVYKATQEIIGREVAVKVLHGHLIEDNDALKRFHQQAKAASRLNHPHIITLYDYGVIAGGQPYIVMDLLKGVSLAQVLEQREYLPLDEAMPLVKQISEALADAHKHGVIHRDVKPDNIVLEEHNDQKHWVKVVDFGIAKIVQGGDETLVRITRTGMVCGSPAYMSPEQFKGQEVDARSDVYSLAVLLFEMLTGRLPFQARDLVTLMSLQVSEVPPKIGKVRPDLSLPAELEKAIEHALNKNPDDRPASMEDFWQELESALAGKPLKSGVGEAHDEPALSGKNIQDLVSAKINARSKQIEEEVQKLARTNAGQPGDGEASGGGHRPVKSRPVVPGWARAVGLLQSLIPFAFTVALLSGLYIFASGDSEMAAILRDKLKNYISFADDDPQQLFDQGKLEQCRETLEKKKAGGSLSHTNSDLLNKVYLRLSDEEARKKNYKEAVSLLEQVQGRGPYVLRAKNLSKKYRRMLSR